jgi:predicted AlkP superfamily phosphohydrolase/phosphomutase
MFEYFNTFKRRIISTSINSYDFVLQFHNVEPQAVLTALQNLGDTSTLTLNCTQSSSVWGAVAQNVFGVNDIHGRTFVSSLHKIITEACKQNSHCKLIAVMFYWLIRTILHFR